MSDDGKKSAFLDDQKFSVEEGATYRVFRTGAIWMNKLFFGSVTLLFVWLLLGWSGAVEPGCVEEVVPFEPEPESGEPHRDDDGQQCSVLLSPTGKYLGAMSALSFTLSIVFGFLGLLVGKRILEMTPHAEETGVKAVAKEEAMDDDQGTDKE